jgi:threonylcarbamoyladenosine tRNA methylthiotransferase MtaB
MKKVCILTLGCKINFYESGQIAHGYKDRGYQIVTKYCPDADIYIINTCAVTAHAEKKSRNTVSRVRRAILTSGGNSAGRLIVCGCSGDRSVNEAQTCHALQGRERAFIKVQDGCNNFCAFCIVPYLRGRSRSRKIDEIVDEIRAAAGKSVVISGIDLSSFGLDIGTNLGVLCQKIDEIGVEFELSSIEIGIITPEFVRILGACKHLLPKFHVPLQSGSDKILIAMNRKYTAEKYLDAIKLLRGTFPNAQISTDIIVGFPGETPEDLAQTHAVAAASGFCHVHTFPYSDRHLERFKKAGGAND